MKESIEPAKVDTMIIITRLNAHRDSDADEFKHGWTAPVQNNCYGGEVNESGLHYYWKKSIDNKAGLLVIHGYNGLFKNSKDFIEKINVCIKFVINKKINCASPWLIYHGTIPGLTDSECPYIRSIKFKKRYISLKLHNYSLKKKLPPALEIPKYLQEMNFPQNLRDLIQEIFSISATVELIVKSMQHIILEIRLLCDLLLEKCDIGSPDRINAVKELLIDCHNRMNDTEHWNNECMRIARQEIFTGATLYAFLDKPANELFCQTANIKKERKTLYRDIYEKHGGAKQLNCTSSIKEAIKIFLNDGDTKYLSNMENIDKGLRVLSARMNALIPAAAEVDRRRNKSSKKEYSKK